MNATCKATTKQGALCLGVPRPSGYCWRHENGGRHGGPHAPAIGQAVPLYPEPADEAEWQRRRREHNGIGASEVWRVLHGDRLCLALERRGERERFSGNDLTALGNAAEPHILRWAEAPKAGWIYQHPEHACLTFTPDGWDAERGRLVEAKWTSGRNRRRVEWFAEYGPKAVWGYAPSRWWVQCQDQMAITGLDRMELAVMVGAEALAMCLAGMDPPERDMLRIPVERDEDYVSAIEEIVPDWHARYVLGDELPPPGPDVDDLREAADRWCIEAGIVAERPDLEDVAGRYHVSREERLEAKRELKAAMRALGCEEMRCGPWSVRIDGRGTVKTKEVTR